MANVESVATLGVALACVVAFATVATTLESSVSTHPDDVIDLDYEQLPIGRDEAADLKEQFQGKTQDERAKTGSTSQPADEPEGDASSATKSSPGQGEPASGPGPDPDGNEVGETSGSGLGQGLGPGAGAVFDWLQWLLRALFPFLLLAGLAAIAYRYRHRLLAALAAILPAGSGSAAVYGGTEWDPGEPSNPVHGAWVELLRRTDLDDPHARTPEECRDAAIADGLDADAVRSLTREFLDVRYGNRPVTDERVRRAQDSLERILGGDGSGDAIQRDTLRRTDGGETA